MLIAALFSLLTFTATDAPGSSPGIHENPVLTTEAELQLALRDLWTGHVFWVRSTIIATHYDDEDAILASEARVLTNARALSDAVEPLYGDEAADQLYGLLGGHYGGIKEYMQANFAQDLQAANVAAKKVTANAEEIADFLDAANPHLPKNAVLPLLMAHGGHHMQQIEAIREGNFSAEAEVWEAMLGHMYTIADAMASAIAKQFPNEFAK